MRLLFVTICVGLISRGFGWVMPKDYPIKPSHDGRHFVTTKGEPFFWQADTAWVVFHRLTLGEVEVYLDDRASKGFNMILAVAVTQFG